MQMFFKTNTGRTITYNLGNEETCQQFQKNIFEHHLTDDERKKMGNPSVDNFHIIIHGKEVDYNKTLNENIAIISGGNGVNSIQLVFSYKKLESTRSSNVRGNTNTLMQSRYQQLPLQTQQLLSETTQFDRHRMADELGKHPSTEDYFNSLTKEEQDSLLSRIADKGNEQDNTCSIM